MQAFGCKSLSIQAIYTTFLMILTILDCCVLPLKTDNKFSKCIKNLRTDTEHLIHISKSVLVEVNIRNRNIVCARTWSCVNIRASQSKILHITEEED